jgi:hypothetical protein
MAECPLPLLGCRLGHGAKREKRQRPFAALNMTMVSPAGDEPLAGPHWPRVRHI